MKKLKEKVWEIDPEVSELENEISGEGWHMTECPDCKKKYDLLVSTKCPYCGFEE